MDIRYYNTVLYIDIYLVIGNWEEKYKNNKKYI